MMFIEEKILFGFPFFFDGQEVAVVLVL